MAVPYNKCSPGSVEPGELPLIVPVEIQNSAGLGVELVLVLGPAHPEFDLIGGGAVILVPVGAQARHLVSGEACVGWAMAWASSRVSS